ncbi:MAG: aminotransferase class I/II-fold pyridoxal phosphate-dependent enzyme [Alphaproteobacteria bacterium]|nr:aminotransferase class I/II-fold pyridoxal phosphate-dependent enzyme [Alphaproteobacteria bacterium]
MHNPRLDGLGDYFFRRLAALLEPLTPAPNVEPIDLSIGQPMHPTPRLLEETLAGNGHLWGRYPPVVGMPDFREAVCDWLTWRYNLPERMLSPDRHVLPVAGTKEALFMLSQLVTPESVAEAKPAVLMPNPFYNVYLGGAIVAGAEPVLLPVTAETDHLPDLDALDPDLLERTVAFFLCSPSNPQGGAADLAYLTRALQLARRHDFLLIMDECYSEIYGDRPPVGSLEAAAALGGALDNLIVCHSLSKRSSAAGLRSGFVAGDATLLKDFARLRSYGAAVQPLPLMAAATALWRDEDHVRENRDRYREKFDLADKYLAGHFDYVRPDGGFFLWLNVGDSEAITRKLWCEAALKVVPGAYLGYADQSGWNPGAHAVRVAMVHDLTTTEQALDRLVGTLC